MSKIGGELSPTARAYLDVLLDTWARPGMNNPDDPASPTGAYADADPETVTACASRDLRSPAQCRHDALEAMLKYFAESGKLGASHRGLPATVVLTMTVAQLEAATSRAVDTSSADRNPGAESSADPFGQVTTPPEERAARQPVRAASGTLLPITEALKLAEKAHPVLVIFDHSGVPLHFGRAKRLASQAQRLALPPNHRGCTHPGCTKPATWTQIHHTREWATYRRTNIDELAPACDEHHALVHDRPNGWATHIVTSGPDTGRCAWTPPKTVDPQRRPLINRVHHPEEMCSGVGSSPRDG